MKRLLYSWPSLVVLLLIAFFLARGAWGVMRKERKSAETLSSLEENAQVLEAREEELLRNIARLETREGVIEEIRKKFNAVREGESVAVIVDRRASATATASSSKVWYRQIWDAIIGK